MTVLHDVVPPQPPMQGSIRLGEEELLLRVSGAWILWISSKARSCLMVTSEN